MVREQEMLASKHFLIDLVCLLGDTFLRIILQDSLASAAGQVGIELGIVEELLDAGNQFRHIALFKDQTCVANNVGDLT